MVEFNPAHLDSVFHALAHPVRRSILRQMGRGECSVSELAAPFDISLEAVSKHIKVLERAKLLKRTRAGRTHRCRMGPAPLKDAAKILVELSSFWNKRLDALEALLAQTHEKE